MSSNEYKLYTSGKYPNPAVLDQNLDEVVFCSKTHKPYIGTGLYKIVHKGIDKRKKTFMIAEPVLDIPLDCDHLYAAIDDIIGFCSWLSLDKDGVSQRHRRFNYHFGRPSSQKVTVEDIIESVKMSSPFELDKIFKTPIVKDGVDFEVVGVSNRIYRPGVLIPIRYVTGETENQTIGWIYKNREHLVNCSLVVYGTTVDNISVEFVDVKEESAI